MTWFKVDDKLHSHSKVLQLVDDGESDAMALWTLAGSWAAEHETDGWVPAAAARRVDPDHYMRRAAALVRVRLWEEAERDGQKGWNFHGWNEPGRQPTKEQIQAARSAKSERQARWRDRSRQNGGNNGPVDGGVDASTDMSTDFRVDAAVDGDLSHEGLADVIHLPLQRGGERLHDGIGSTSRGSTVTIACGQRPSALFAVDDFVDASTRASRDASVGAFPTRPDPTYISTSPSAPATPETDHATVTRSKSPTPATADRPDVEALCNRLVELMVANGCKPPTVTKRWRDAARLMLDADGRDFDKAMALLEWSQKDEFWSSNIHSLPKFREKYDQLRQRALATWKRDHSPNTPGRTAYTETDDRTYGSLASAFDPTGA